jgi:MYXO-CTERM domain-containing protein
MPSSPVFARSAAPLALSALLALAAAPARAQEPVAPGADAFSILYYLTDSAGDRGRLMTTYDFQRFANIARCECGQRIEALVRILNKSGTTYSNVPMTAYVGSTCSTIENTVNSTFRRCAIGANGFTSDFQYSGQAVKFSPLWLYRGVDESLGDRNLSDAFAAGDCRGGIGAAGVWVCAQTDSLSGCQDGEFIITGTQQNNVLPDPMSTMPVNGIAFDFVPPAVDITSIDAVVGDGAVEVRWGLPQVNPDIAGYRVLCEEAATGLPGLPDRNADLLTRPPVIPNRLDGTLYFTKENLCPDGPFWSPPGWSEEPDTTSTGGDTDATTTDATTTDATTTDATTTDATTTDATTTDATTTDTDGITESAFCPGERPSTGVCSLKWDYVCSLHIGGASKSVRISGLKNDTPYNFLLVAYDSAGNPIEAGLLNDVAPRATNDFWDQCVDDQVCGNAGFCRVEPQAPSGLLGPLGLALAFLGAARRRRQGAAC